MQLNYAQAAQVLETWQSLVDQNLLVELGNNMEFRRGPVKETVTFTMFGALYQEELKPLFDLVDKLNITLKPVVTLQGGTYIDSVRILGQPNPLDNVHTAPDVNDTFYVKSLMIPETLPLNSTAWKAFTKYLAEEGYDSPLVSHFFHQLS